MGDQEQVMTNTVPDSLWELELPQSRSHVNLYAVQGALAAYLPRPAGWEWLHDAVVQLKEFLLLSEGWDGMGARPIEGLAIERARALLERLVEVQPTLARPFIAPTIRGGVALEWHADPIEVEIVIEPEEPVMIYGTDGEREWEGPLGESPLEAFDLLLGHFTHR